MCFIYMFGVMLILSIYYVCLYLSAFRTLGVPGPTSKLSSRAPAQMGRRETEREGGEEAGGRQA
jgi:hypothetical protein